MLGMLRISGDGRSYRGKAENRPWEVARFFEIVCFVTQDQQPREKILYENRLF